MRPASFLALACRSVCMGSAAAAIGGKVTEGFLKLSLGLACVEGACVCLRADPGREPAFVAAYPADDGRDRGLAAVNGASREVIASGVLGRCVGVIDLGEPFKGGRSAATATALEAFLNFCASVNASTDVFLVLGDSSVVTEAFLGGVGSTEVFLLATEGSSVTDDFLFELSFGAFEEGGTGVNVGGASDGGTGLNAA